MRSPALACLLALVVPALAVAQSGPADELWVSGYRYDRFGMLSGSVAPSFRGASFRRSPNGEVWALTAFNQLALLDASGNPIGTWALGSGAGDVVADAAGDAWVSLSTGVVERRDRSGNITASFTLPGPGQAMALDETGRLWIGVRNQPAALLSWRALTGGPVFTVGLPASLGVIPVDVVVDGRAGGSHAWVIGYAGRDVVELDRRGAVIATYSLASSSSAGLAQLASSPTGEIWVAADDGLWSIDPASGTVRHVTYSDVGALTFDAKGALWITERGTLTKMDVAAGRPQFVGRSGVSSMDDAAGLTLAQFVDRGGDFDGDGFRNGDEVDAGTNPFDALSSPRLDFGSSRLENPAGSDVELVARGELGWGFVLFGAPRAAPPVTIPGIDGALLLQSVLPANLPMPVPGRATLRVPPGAALGATGLQMLRVPLGTASPRLGELAVVRFAPLGTLTVREDFATGSRLDRARSSGTWSQGVARGGALGGVGRLGSFDHRVGSEVSPGVFEFRTDGQVFPASVTLFGRTETVTDGVFEFTDFVVPAGITVRFVGAKPAVVRVRGTARIDGVVDVSGADVPSGFDARAPALPVGSTPIGVAGQPGSAGGAGAGSGGRGGDGCPGGGTGGGAFAGQPGQDLAALARSGYASAVAGTGGPGGPLWPTSGLSSSVVFNLFFAITGQVASGGGGGGYRVAGGFGRALRTFTGTAADLAPDVPGGAAVAFLPQPVGVSALEHFLLGGSGGGGGGSHPVNMTSVQIGGSTVAAPQAWHAGAGGAGGGGAIGLRVGNDLVVGTTGAIACRGGSGAIHLTQNTGPPAPGGGGSGGSVVLQVGGALAQGGTIDLRGGAGGSLSTRQFNGLTVDAVGGDGAPGFVRLETGAGASVAALGTVRGPTLGTENAGVLSDEDTIVGQVSGWYRVGWFSPRWLHYTMRVLVNGAPVDFSDDPAAFNPAVGPGMPVQLFLQAAPLRENSQVVGSPGPWRPFAGDLNLDGGTGFRFMLLFDRSVARDVAVDDLQVVITP